MREFGEKYAGDVQAALRGMQREKMGGTEVVGEIDKTTRKRKWVASQEAEAAGIDMEGSKNVKNARTMSTSPKKKAGSSTGPGTAQRARLVAANRTPATSRTMGRVPASPSPAKPARPFQHNPTTTHISPSKPNRATRPPSLATFNPALPKTPGFPKTHNNTHSNARNGTTTARIPRRHESMLSVNGSPLANPYELGLEWFAEGGDADDDAGNDSADGAEGGSERDKDRRKRAKSIIVRRDPSFSLQSAPIPMSNGLHSRTTSQSSLFPSSSQSQSSQPFNPHSTPSRPTTNGTTRLPARTGAVTALVTIPTKDGHLLEFDPLQTSPGTLDALEGISDSAKKQAREEMVRLVQAAVNMWKIA